MRTQVVNNCQGPHYIQCQKVGNLPGKLIVLSPGLNLVETKELAELRKTNKVFDELFKAKIKPSKAEEADVRSFGKPMLEVRSGELPDTSPLAKLSLDDAKAILAVTQNTDLLKEWLGECIPGVQSDLAKAISARMKEVTAEISASNE